MVHRGDISRSLKEILRLMAQAQGGGGGDHHPLLPWQQGEQDY